jgi:predicted RNA binding protein YcfA (HicA-like mRNA interferase family)
MPSEKRFAEVRKLLESHGWFLERITSSHHVFSKPGEPMKISVPVHGNRVKPNYVRIIQKKIEEDQRRTRRERPAD